MLAVETEISVTTETGNVLSWTNRTEYPAMFTSRILINNNT